MQRTLSLKLFNCLIILLSGNFIFSQTEISGTVKDSLTKPIAFANITLKRVDKNSIIAFTTSNSEGVYKLVTHLQGDFELSYSGFSYKTIKRQVSIFGDTQIRLDIILPYESVHLDEVIIQTERNIIRKEDTVIFRADAFLKGDEIVVEDLLRRIPGLTIDEDGTIKVGNREVEKVMVDGDDFFEKGYKLLTKNMNAEAIDKISIYERYSNNRLLKGIEESERVALNLTLREGLKQQWFGNMSLGYGAVSENRYSVRTNLMSFGKNAKYYFLGNLNNVGTDATGDLDQLIRPSSNGDPGHIGEGQSAITLLSLEPTLPLLKRERVKFNNTEVASLNGIFSIKEKIKLKSMALFNWDENDFFRNSFSEFSIENSQFVNIENQKKRKKTFTGFGKVDLTYDISKSKMLEYTGKINNTDDKLKSDLIFNSIESSERLDQNNHLINQHLIYTNKIDESKVFLLSGRYVQEKSPQRYNNSQFLYSELFSDTDSVNSVSQLSENFMQFLGAEAHLLNRKDNGNLFEIKAGVSYRDDDLETSFRLEENSEIVEEPEGFSNNLNYRLMNFYGESNYSYSFGKVNLLAGMRLNQIFNRFSVLDFTQDINSFYVIPSIGLKWQINKNNRITSQYNYTTKIAAVDEVYPGFVLSNFRNFTAGTASLEQLNATSLLFSHTFGNWSDKFSTNTSFSYTKNHDFFTDSSLVTPFFTQARKILMKDMDYLNINTISDKYLKAISSNLKLNLGFTRSNYKNIVNEELRNVKFTNLRYGAELRSGFLGAFNFHLGTSWLSNTVSTNSSDFKNTDNITFFDVSFSLNKNLNFNLQSERYFFSGIDSQKSSFFFSDLVARYTTKNQKINFMISGKNLFNTKTFRDIYIDDIRKSQTEYKLIPRYVLLSVDFRF